MRNELKERTKAFACRARSRRDFIGKMGIVEEEADESQFWLELIIEHGLLPAQRASPLRDEAGQLVAIAVASIRTARGAGSRVPRSALRIPQSS
jgi:four helix bundle protein